MGLRRIEGAELIRVGCGDRGACAGMFFFFACICGGGRYKCRVYPFKRNARNLILYHSLGISRERREMLEFVVLTFWAQRQGLRCVYSAEFCPPDNQVVLTVEN